MLGLSSLSLSIGSQQAASGGGAAATTWNPADKAATVSLTNGNLTATNSSGVFAGVRGTNSKTTGKWYTEAKLLITNNQPSVGFANATESLTAILGNDTNGVAFISGSLWYGGGLLASVGTYVVNDIVQLAVDIDAGKIWAGVNNTYTGSPSAGTGASLVPGIVTFFPAFAAKDGSFLAQFTAASQSFAPPTGFTAFG